MRRIILSATIWLLLLGNLAYFVWAQGILAPLGFGKNDQSEPQRLTRQISPERIVLHPAQGAKAPTDPANRELSLALSATRPPTAAAIAQLNQTPAPPPVVVSSIAPVAAPLAAVPASVAANAPAQCLQSSPFDGKLLADVRRTLETQWPSGSWKISTVSKPGRWLVYMGKYPNIAAYEKKQGELNTLKVPYRPVKNQALMPGLSLGEFDTQTKANQALQDLGKLGIRTAKVVQDFGGGTSHVAIIHAFAPKQQGLLEALQTKLGGAMQSCDKTTSG